jgi:anti-sigma regulatory factor (Ser/Thr protein kinase)
MTALAPTAETEDGFRHEAFFYGDEDQFVEGAAAFLSEGLRAEEPALVVVSSRKIDLLRERLAADAAKVQFADMDDVGLNPARIIPAWTDFVNTFGGQRLRGIGEPIWADRSADELIECQRHESLLNVAFAENSGFRLLCPYDTSALEVQVVDEARRSHPFLCGDGSQAMSAHYVGTEVIRSPFSAPLPDPPSSCTALDFQRGSLIGLRRLVLRQARRAGLGEMRAADAVTAVNEVASNSLRHAGGSGRLRIWLTDTTFICEVRDDGQIDEPLVGRTRPPLGTSGGRGLWMVNQLCELVQVRSAAAGTTVRMHVRRPAS